MILTKKLWLVVFGLFLATGFFLRLYKITSLPGGFFIDEVNIAVDAKSLVENGTDQYGRPYPFVFEDATDYKLPGYIYTVAVAYKFLGPHLLTVRIPSLLASIGSIPAIGYLTFLLFPKKKRLALFSMSVLSLSPFAIHFARIGYETVLATFFLLLFLIAVLKVINNEKPLLWYIIGLIFMVASLWTYPAPRFIIPIFLVLFGGYLWTISDRKKKQQTLIPFFIFVFFALLTFIPSLLFRNLEKRPLSYLLEDVHGTFWVAFWSKFTSVVSSLLRNFNWEFLFDKGSFFGFRHGTKENGVLLPIFIFPFLSGLYVLLKNTKLKDTSYVFLNLLTVLTLLPSALTSPVPYMTRLVPFLIPLSIILALGIDLLYEYLSKQKKTVQIIVIGTTAVALIFQTVAFGRIYFSHFRVTSLPEFPTAPRELADFVTTYEKQNPKTLVYFLNDATCHNWGEDGLHLWYFANLPDKEMIAWNNEFRDKRFASTIYSPFDGLDKVTPPTRRIGNIILFPGYVKIESVPSGSLFIRCGYQLPHISTTKEKILQIMYMYEDTKLEPFYVVSKKI